MNCVWVVVNKYDRDCLGAPYWFASTQQALDFAYRSFELYPHLPQLHAKHIPFCGMKRDSYGEMDFTNMDVPKECRNVIIVKDGAGHKAMELYHFDAEEMDMLWDVTLSLYP